MRCQCGVFQTLFLILLFFVGIFGGIAIYFHLKGNRYPKHILDLTLEEKVDFLQSFDHILSDCDGVLWKIVDPIEGAGEGISLLLEAGKSIKLITNNAMRTDQELIEKLSTFGITNLEGDDFIRPDKTIASYVKSNPKYKNVAVLAGRLIKESLTDIGITVIDKPKIQSDFTFETFSDSIIANESIEAVIVDLYLDQSLVEYSRALLYLKNYPECDLIVGAYDLLIPISENTSVPGPKLLIDYMERYSKKKPIILGKPGAELKIYIKEHYNITKPSRYLFIGDNLFTDIGFGNSMNFQTLLVLSGVTTPDEMLTGSIENKPTYYADSLGDFIQFFEELK